MNKGIIYCTKIREEYEGAHMEHMIAEKLLEIALKKEYGINLYNEPRAEGEHGKPFLPENMWYVFWLIRRLELMCRFIA